MRLNAGVGTHAVVRNVLEEAVSARPTRRRVAAPSFHVDDVEQGLVQVEGRGQAVGVEAQTGGGVRVALGKPGGHADRQERQSLLEFALLSGSRRLNTPSPPRTTSPPI